VQGFRAGPERPDAKPGDRGLMLMEKAELLGRLEPIHQIGDPLGHWALRVAEHVVCLAHRLSSPGVRWLPTATESLQRAFAAASKRFDSSGRVALHSDPVKIRAAVETKVFGGRRLVGAGPGQPGIRPASSWSKERATAPMAVMS
jgi:hypothetical protein